MHELDSTPSAWTVLRSSRQDATVTRLPVYMSFRNVFRSLSTYVSEDMLCVGSCTVDAAHTPSLRLDSVNSVASWGPTLFLRL